MIELPILYWQYWNGIIDGVPAFPRGTVPVGQVFPYITYDINDYGMLNNGLNDVFIWTRTGNLQQLYSYLGEVRKALPEGGVTLLLPDNAGAIKLYRGNPFYQDYEQEDAAIKAGRILIQVNSYIY